MAGIGDVIAANPSVFKKLLFFTFLMVLLPIGVFFGLQHFWDGTENAKNTVAAIGAVIAANVVIALYVIMAWHEGQDDPVQAEQDKKRT